MMTKTKIDPITAPTLAIVGYPVFFGDIISSVVVMISGTEKKRKL